MKAETKLKEIQSEIVFQFNNGGSATNKILESKKSN